jgi:hypothetical protein
MEQQVERWGIFEVTLQGPSEGNPFTEVSLQADFTFQHRTMRVNGFYDGVNDSGGVYRVRFMPDAVGEWHYITRSSTPALDGKRETFTCTAPHANNHGPVVVRDTFHFAYSDGTPYFPIGTTCYAWAHQGEAMEQQTLETLSSASFNKIRMCVFPKHYDYNHNEPDFFAYERKPDDGGGYAWDFTRFNPAFFQHFERLVEALGSMGIEADLILLHPYDRWGFSKMGPENDDHFLRYVVSRMAAYRNVWWSMANEFDFMEDRTVGDWDRYFKIVQETDPYQHLRSVHNGFVIYDHTKPWVTHASVQSSELHKVRQWREQYRKPIVVDECCYEGNVHQNWGNISGIELMHRFLTGTVGGGYVGHGETFLHPQDILWWAKGGTLTGDSPARIAFLRRLLEQGSQDGLNPYGDYWYQRASNKAGTFFLFYTGVNPPGEFFLDLPEGQNFSVEVIDPWEMTSTPLVGTFQGRCKVALPSKPYLLIRAQKIN